MDQRDPPQEEPGLGPDGDPRSALRHLEARLDRASAAAERLIAEAGDLAASRLGRRPPPAGWQAPAAARVAGTGADADGGDDGALRPGAGAGAADRAAGDLEVLASVLRSLRDLVPDDLARRISEALRELLLAIRALIDWYVDRLERFRPEPAPVEDIPIR